MEDFGRVVLGDFRYIYRVRINVYMFFHLEYASARVRVMRSKLLPEEDVMAVAESGKMSELVSILSGTMYESFVDGSPDSGAGLKGLIISTEDKIASFLPKEMKDDFSKIILAHEIDNAKMIFRGVSAGFLKDEIMSDLYPKGVIFEKAGSSFPNNFDEAVLLFKEIPIVGRALLMDYSSVDVANIERQVDVGYFKVLAGVENLLFRDYVKFRSRLLDNSVAARGQEYREDVSKDIFAPEFGGNTGKIESSDDKVIMAQVNKYVLNDPFGIGLYLEFLVRLERDVNVICAARDKVAS